MLILPQRYLHELTVQAYMKLRAYTLYCYGTHGDQELITLGHRTSLTFSNQHLLFPIFLGTHLLALSKRKDEELGGLCDLTQGCGLIPR